MNFYDLMIRRSRYKDASDSSSSGASDSSSSTGDISDSSSSSVTIPSDYVFYAPLSTDLSELSQYARTITAVNGTPVFETQDGIPCCKLPSSTYLTTSYDSGITSGNHDFTMSIWVKPDASRLNAYEFFYFVGVANNYQVFKMMNSYGVVEFDTWGFDNPSNTSVYAGWMHLVGRYTASTRAFDTFVNGEKVHTRTKYSDMNLAGSGQISVGGSTAGYSAQGNEWYADALVYDRALTDAEIADLASQHSVTFSIEVQDETFSYYPSYSEKTIQVTSVNTPSFEIISGTLPSTISFDTSTGMFYGSAPLDDDHVYQVQVRVTALNSTPATATITLNTYATARINIDSSSITFVRDGSESFTISYFSDESVTFAVETGYTLPSGITLSGDTLYCDGTTTAGSYTIEIRGTSEHNQTGSTGTFYITVQANVITIDTTSLTFYVSKGVETKQLSYSTTKHSITPVYTLTGNLPSGVTFNTSTGVFTSDGTQSSASTASVSVTVASSTGLSTTGSGTVTVKVEMEAPPVPQDYIFYAPLMQDLTDQSSVARTCTPSATEYGDQTSQIATTTYMGMACTYIPRGAKLIYSPNGGLNLGNTAKTESLWINCAFNSGGWNVGLCFGQNSYYKLFALGWNERKVAFGGYGNDIYSEGVYIPQNEWHHIAVTYDTTAIRLYLDGVLVRTNQQSSYINTGTSDIAVGGRPTNGDDYCDAAYFHSARIYNRALSASEILQLAQEFDEPSDSSSSSITPILPTDENKSYPLSSNLKDAKHSDNTDYDLTKPTSTSVSYSTSGGITGATVTNGCLYNTYASGARTNGCALSAWVKFNSNPSSSNTLKVLVNGSNSSSSQHGFWMGYKGGVYVAGTSTSASITTSVSTNTSWHHLLLNYDKDNLVLDYWIDGTLAGTNTLSSALSGSSGTVINAITGANSNPDGFNDTSTRYADVKYYNRTLSEAEILGLAQEH